MKIPCAKTISKSPPMRKFTFFLLLRNFFIFLLLVIINGFKPANLVKINFTNYF
jgi:hypothetical protein